MAAGLLKSISNKSKRASLSPGLGCYRRMKHSPLALHSRPRASSSCAPVLACSNAASEAATGKACTASGSLFESLHSRMIALVQCPSIVHSDCYALDILKLPFLVRVVDVAHCGAHRIASRGVAVGRLQASFWRVSC
jgi:hypothetical protein